MIGCLFKGVAKANNLTYDLCAKALTTSSDRALKHADDADKEIHTHNISKENKHSASLRHKDLYGTKK